MDIVKKLHRRFAYANRVMMSDIEFMYHALGDEGQLSFGYRLNHQKHAHVGQVYIPKTMVPSLVAGRKNRNLDNHLRVIPTRQL